MNKVRYADDDTESVNLLMRLRVPSLAIGLLLGLALSFLTSQFEEVLTTHIAVTFFIPFIVYLAAAVGTQTQSIYVRDLKSGTARFKTYLVKETLIGLLLGLLFCIITAVIVMLWFRSTDLALAVGLSVLGAVASAPLVALVVTEMLELKHTDPAVGAGPIGTIIQDAVSILIYGFISSAILL